ncbi:uncharacterized protein L199_002626 [Kwoniella botswanensis]|uniref:uncharacterized protein n=1 Tax=Kwoniella botswanensis TaxID=1268659 RepID=UPI00315C580F
MEAITSHPPHSLPQRPKYPLGQPPENSLRYARRPIDCWRAPLVNPSSNVKSKPDQHAGPAVSEETSISATSLHEDEYDPSLEVPGMTTYKRSREANCTGKEMECIEEEGTTVICGSMEDDTPIKKRKLPIKRTPQSSPTPSSQLDGLSMTVEHTETVGTFIVPQSCDGRSYTVQPSVNHYSLPTPRTTPITTQFSHDFTADTVAHTAALLAFLSESHLQAAVSLLPSTLSPAHRQALVDLEGRMSKVDDDRSFLTTKVSSLEEKLDFKTKELRDHEIIYAGVESELKITKEKYRKLKILYEKKDETVQSLKKSIGDMEDRHEQHIQRKVKDLEIEHTLNLASRIVEIESQKEEESRGKVEELGEKHQSEMIEKLKEVDVQHKLEIALIKSDCAAQVKDWRDQAESLIQERDQLRVNAMAQEVEREVVDRNLEKSRKDEAHLSEALKQSNLQNQANRLEIDSLILQVMELGSAFTSKEGKIHCLETEKDVLEKLIEERDVEVDKLNSKMTSIENLSNFLQQQKDTKVTSLSVENEALKVSRTNLEAKIVEMESKAKEQHEKSLKTQEELSIYISKAKRYEQLKKDFDSLAKDMELLDKEYKHCQSENQIKSQQTVNLTSQIESLRSSVAQRHSQVERLNEQNLTARIKIFSTEDEKKEWMKLAEDRQRDNMELQKKVERLEKQRSEFCTPTVARSSVRSTKELEMIRKEKSALEKELKEIQSERVWFWDVINGYKDKDASAKADLGQIEELNRRLEEELDEAKNSCDHLKASLELAEMKEQESEVQLEQISAENITSNNTISMLQEQIASLQEKVKKLEKCRVALEKSEKERETESGSERLLTVQSPSTDLFEKRLANSQQRVTDLQLEIAGKDDEIGKLKDLKKNLEVRCNNLDQSHKDRDRRLYLCITKIKELERSIAIGEKEGVIANLTQEVGVIRGLKLQMEERIKEKEETIRMLNQKLVEFQSDLDRYISAYQLPRQDLSIPNHILRNMTQLKTRHEQSTSFRSKIMERVANRANHLQDLMTDHRSMKNERSYNVSKREYEHCSHLLNMLKDLDGNERQLGKLIDEMKA